MRIDFDQIDFYKLSIFYKLLLEIRGGIIPEAINLNYTYRFYIDFQQLTIILVKLKSF